MGRSRYGQGRHRQPWLPVICPHCGLHTQARRTLPDRPFHIRAHFTDDGTLCPPATESQVPNLVFDAQ